MIRTHSHSYIFLLLVAAVILTLCGCSKNTPTVDTLAKDNHSSFPEKQGTKLKHLSSEAKNYLAGKHICIIYGYGCNDSSFVQKSLFQLSAAYGVETENNPGLILAFVFPDDFMHNGTPRISMLKDLIDDRPLAGMIILGAPEGANDVVARLEDAAGGTLPYPVFSFFSQDDVLGTESISNFVLDYAQQSNTIGSEENTQILGDEVFDLIMNSVQSMISLRGPVPADKNLHGFVQKIVGSHKTVNRYVDSETGLQSVNHFVID